MESRLETFERKKGPLEVALEKQKINENRKEKSDKLKLDGERIRKRIEEDLKIEQVNLK